MRQQYNILHLLWVVVTMTLVTSCSDSQTVPFALSCGESMTIAEGATEIIEVRGGGDFTFTVDNKMVSCEKRNNALYVTGVKVGKSLLTVVSEGGKQLTCTITVDGKSDFLIYSTPRVENWLNETVYTEETPGVQVTCERNIDASGEDAAGVTTYGFYNLENGAYCRLSAQGTFDQEGVYSQGVAAIALPNEKVQYYLCEKVEIVKAYENRLWIVATFASRSDLRIVTEIF